MVEFEFGNTSFVESGGIVSVQVALRLENVTLGTSLDFDIEVTNGTAVEGSE